MPGIGDAERTLARIMRRKTETIRGVVVNFSILVYGILRDLTEGEELSLTFFLFRRWLNSYGDERVVVRKRGSS